MSRLGKLVTSFAGGFLVFGLLTVAAYAEENKAGVIQCEVLNVRQEASTTAKIVSKLPKGTTVTVTGESSGEWLKISYGDTDGWVFGEYLTVKELTSGTGTVTGTVVNVREKAQISSKVLAQLKKGAQVKVTTSSGDWYKVETASGVTGFISKDYLTLKVTVSSSSRGSDAASSDLGQKIVAFAKQYMGVKYVWGGTSPKGFDCSGLVYYTYKNYGMTLNRVAADQATQGVKVGKADLIPGDLVFFDTDGGKNRINHVGIYAGGGKFVHASSGQGEVTVTSLASGFYNDCFMTARRVIK